MIQLYDGPSLLDGQPIIVSLTGHDTPSTNRKTGPMVQAFILHKQLSPVEANRTGADQAVCGSCPHRNGSCYVLLHQAPTAAWKAKPSKTALTRSSKTLRIGAYGDPAAVPFDVWHRAKSFFRGHTGYTHQWRSADPKLQTLCMASVDTPEEALEAQALGWRTFRIKRDIDPVLPNEVQCPAQTHEVQCHACLLCSGRSTAGKHVVANLHGATWKQQRFLANAATSEPTPPLP